METPENPEEHLVLPLLFISEDELPGPESLFDLPRVTEHVRGGKEPATWTPGSHPSATHSSGGRLF